MRARQLRARGRRDTVASMKYFNTAGPCIEGMHYMLPPLSRIPEARGLVERGSYFVVHAPRQSGKTTALRALAQALTEDGRHAALAFSCETSAATGDDYAAAQRAILDELRLAAQVDLPAELQPPAVWPATGPESQIRAALAAWAMACPRPLVLLLDEIDAVRGESLRSVLSQLRAGFQYRGRGFPWSVVLCGLRDVRDYRIASGADPDRAGSSSPFNVKTKSLRLGAFNQEEIAALLGQHTAATGQPFADGAVARALELTGGQPWLVNALAREIIEEIGVPPTEAITAAHCETAKERLILARQTHLDSLVARLQEPRVRRVVAPLLAGDAVGGDAYDDDVSFVRDLGLVVDKPLRIANPIYREVIVRVLAGAAEANIQLPGRQWVDGAGRLDLRALLDAFAAWWREQGSAIAPKMPYHEVAAQLILSAWLQRVVNGGGFVDREYGVGMRRIDVLVRWPLPPGGWQREALELKMRRDGEADPTAEGLRQIDATLASLGLDHGWLVVFDRRTDAPPVDDRTRFDEAVTTGGRGVSVLHA
ncbi:MAG: hypothetical protein AMXMBFR64_52620 [Myxococcales bacterium]